MSGSDAWPELPYEEWVAEVDETHDTGTADSRNRVK